MYQKFLLKGAAVAEEPTIVETAPPVEEVKQKEVVAQVDPATKPEAPNDKAGESGMSIGMTAVIALVFSLITNACMLMAYDHFMAQKVLSVDVKGFIEQQQDLFLAGKITGEQLKDSYKRLLETVENIPRNRVVVMGDAVLGGAEKLEITVAPKK
jgi:hypothetical protein